MQQRIPAQICISQALGFGEFWDLFANRMGLFLQTVASTQVGMVRYLS